MPDKWEKISGGVKVLLANIAGIHKKNTFFQAYGKVSTPS